MTAQELKTMIRHYTNAEMAVLEGKSIRFNGQEMTYENLSEIRKGRQEYERRLAGLTSTGKRRKFGAKLLRFG